MATKNAKVPKKWAVHGSVVGGKFLGYYEAATKEEAEEKAMDEHGGPISLCHHCSSECEDGTVETCTAVPA